MALSPKKKLVLVGLMLVISCIGLFIVISTDDVKKQEITIDGNLILENGTRMAPVVTYDPYTGSSHVSMIPAP